MSLSDLFLVNTRANDPLNANAPPSTDPRTTGTAKASDFLTKQSAFSFAAATGLVKLLWKGAEALGQWGHSTWVAAAIAGMLGLVQVLTSIGHPDSKLNLTDYPTATLIAFVNTCVLWLAALGIHDAKLAVS